MESLMAANIGRLLARSGAVVALALVLTVLAACGSAAEPPTAAPEPTQAQATAAPAAEGDSAPAGRLAPTFELPNAAGESISLASYAGDRNVVLVFYRGFW